MVLTKKSSASKATRRAKILKKGLSKVRAHRHHTGPAREVRRGMRVHCKDSDYKHLKRLLKAHKDLKLGRTSKSGFRKVVRRKHSGKKSAKKSRSGKKSHKKSRSGKKHRK